MVNHLSLKEAKMFTGKPGVGAVVIMVVTVVNRAFTTG
jgi:hypothetical protein